MTTIQDLTTLALRSTGDEAIAIRLALADALEERGDPLGEAIRLACELKQLNSYYSRTPWDVVLLHSGDVQDRIAAIRPVVLGELLRAVDEAWPICTHCNGKGDIDPFGADCPDCGCSGRVGKLWRDCPECGKRGRLWLPGDGGHPAYDCTRCDGAGVLLEVECPICIGGIRNFRQLSDPPDAKVCPQCNATGYIPSPLAALHERLALLFMPEADGVRRGDVQTILQLLKGSSDGEQS